MYNPQTEKLRRKLKSYSVNVKEQIVKERGYKNIRLQSEQVSEFEYQPIKCRKPYRIVVLRKNLSIETGEEVLFDDIRYFFYITNDRQASKAGIVREANARCNQENLIAQLKNGVRAIRVPVDGLVSNWAYMVMASLAWNEYLDVFFRAVESFRYPLRC